MYCNTQKYNLKYLDLIFQTQHRHNSVAYDIAGDYFQALSNITAPAALMVRQQSSLIITPEWEYSS